VEISFLFVLNGLDAEHLTDGALECQDAQLTVTRWWPVIFIRTVLELVQVKCSFGLVNCDAAHSYALPIEWSRMSTSMHCLHSSSVVAATTRSVSTTSATRLCTCSWPPNRPRVSCSVLIRRRISCSIVSVIIEVTWMMTPQAYDDTWGLASAYETLLGLSISGL
jgi:hypothetical protein